MKMSKRKLGSIVAAGGLVAVLVMSGTFAYLTDNETVTNVFTIGELQIDLVEVNTPKEDETYIPNQVIAKDPKVVNTGENTSAIVFLEVDIPIKDVVVVNGDGTAVDYDAEYGEELFKLLVETIDGPIYGMYRESINSDWVQLFTSGTIYDTNGVSEEDAVNFNKDSISHITYVYGYTKALEPNDGETPPLFDAVRFANVIERQVDGSIEIPIRAYAIQSEYLGDNDKYDIINLSTADLIEIYTIFINQNSNVISSDGLKAADTNGKLQLNGDEINN